MAEDADHLPLEVHPHSAAPEHGRLVQMRAAVLQVGDMVLRAAWPPHLPISERLRSAASLCGVDVLKSHDGHIFVGGRVDVGEDGLADYKPLEQWLLEFLDDAVEGGVSPELFGIPHRFMCTAPGQLMPVDSGQRRMASATPIEICGPHACEIARELGDGSKFAIEPGSVSITYNDNDAFFWIALTFTEVVKLAPGGRSPAVLFENVDGHVTLIYAPATVRDEMPRVAELCTNQAQSMGRRRYTDHFHGYAHFEAWMAPGPHYAWCDLLRATRFYNACCAVGANLRSKLSGQWKLKENYHVSFRTCAATRRIRLIEEVEG